MEKDLKEKLAEEKVEVKQELEHPYKKWVEHTNIQIKPVSTTVFGLICFGMAFSGAVLNLPCFLLLKGEPFVKISWRFIILFLIISPVALLDILANITNIWNIFLKNLPFICGLSILNTMAVYTLYLSSEMTYVAHTLLLSGIAPTFVVAWKIVKKTPYTTLEILGIGFNVFGAYWCCCDDGMEGNKSNLLMGDFMALFSSCLSAAYMLLSTSVLEEGNCPSSIYLASMSAGTIGISIFLGYAWGTKMEIFSLHADNSVFGFLSSQDSFIYGFLGLGVMAGVAYYFGTLLAKQYIGSMFVNVSFNFTPFISQVVTYVLGAQHKTFPGMFTAFGGFTLFLGCTFLSMDVRNQVELSKIPMIGEEEWELDAIETTDNKE